MEIKCIGINGRQQSIGMDNEARFVWTEDFSKTSTCDVMLEVNAAPFINAGLDTSQLPGECLKVIKL